MITSKVTNRMRKNRKRILDIKTGNGMIVHVEEESDVSCSMRTIQRRHKANKDDMTYTLDRWRDVSNKIVFALDIKGSDISNSHWCI